MNFQDLSDRCRTPGTRAALCIALEASAVYDEGERASIEEVFRIVRFARKDWEKRQLQRREIQGALERLMPDGRYSPLTGLSPQIQGRDSCSQQGSSYTENLFYTGQ